MLERTGWPLLGVPAVVVVRLFVGLLIQLPFHRRGRGGRLLLVDQRPDGQIVPADQLTDSLWDDDHRPTAREVALAGDRSTNARAPEPGRQGRGPGPRS